MIRYIVDKTSSNITKVIRNIPSYVIGRSLLNKKKTYNFSAGPATLPLSVKKKAHEEFFNFNGTGSNFMELSHRDASGPVQNTIKENELLLRDLLKIPKNYKVFFMQGGAHAQFSAIPLNLDAKIGEVKKTGFWSEMAAQEQKRHTEIITPSNIRSRVDYTYLCLNETIAGREILKDLDDYYGSAPVIADATSTLLSRPIDISKYGMIFASSGKNLGPSGITTVICREDLIKERPNVPGILSWYTHAYSEPVHSIYNTPPTWQVYMMNLILKDLQEKGGVKWAEEKAIRLSSRVYSVIDNSNIYINQVPQGERSRMNIPFTIRKNWDVDNLTVNEVVNDSQSSLTDKFIREAENRGLYQLQGHPLFGGLRVTLYNGIEDESVETLITFMKEFNDDVVRNSESFD